MDKTLEDIFKKQCNTFELSENHLKLLEKMQVRYYNNMGEYCDDGFGMIAIDSKRPFGNDPIIRDIAEILNIEPSGVNEDGFFDETAFSEEQIVNMRKIYQDLPTALQIVLSTGKFESGFYIANKYSNVWRKPGED